MVKCQSVLATTYYQYNFSFSAYMSYVMHRICFLKVDLYNSHSCFQEYVMNERAACNILNTVTCVLRQHRRTFFFFIWTRENVGFKCFVLLGAFWWSHKTENWCRLTNALKQCKEYICSLLSLCYDCWFDFLAFKIMPTLKCQTLEEPLQWICLV